MSRTTAVLLTVLLLGASAPAARGDDADEARETFQSLFGKEVAKVQATPAAEDDVALAARLVKTAGEATESPAFLSLLCDHAYRLAAVHPSGRDTAARAMELVAEHVPGRREEARERIQRIRQEQAGKADDDEPQDAGERKDAGESKGGPEAELDALLAQIEAKKQAGALVEAAALYRKARAMAKAAGDDRLPAIEAAAEALARRIGLERRARDVRAMLERQPENVAAREGLVRLYLVNLNDPKRAAEVLEGVEDKDLGKYVPAAAKPPDEAPELACLQLGEWYARLAGTAPGDARASMYGRSKAYLVRFLSLHEAKDLHSTRGTVTLGKVNEALAKLSPAATAAAEEPCAAEETVWLDTLDLSKATCGWNKPQRNRALNGAPLRIAGHGFQRGIGTHAPGRFVIQLDGGAKALVAYVGIDDEVSPRPSAPKASVVFKVLGDGKVLWESGVMRVGDGPKAVRVDLAGVKYLELLVTDAGDGLICDHADWVARLEGADPAKVHAVSPPPN